MITYMYKRNSVLEKAMYFGTEIITISRARSLRKDMTEAEKKLWARLRNKRLLGYKFRRQQPIKFFIADFFCQELKLIIEVDGGYHFTKFQREKDEGRTHILNELGLKVIRFSNQEVFEDLDGVVTRIKDIMRERIPPNPPKMGEE
jgi:very-short-patch-repair endonuclease